MLNKIITVIVVALLVIGIYIIIQSFDNKDSETEGILYVGSGEDADYSSIQDAIDNASDGDIIYVSPGTYIVEGKIAPITGILINKSISLIGTSYLDTKIIGDFAVLTIIANWTNISGFSIISNATYKSAVYFKDAIRIRGANNCRIENNNISSNNFPYGMGITLHESNNNTIVNNTISNNFSLGISLSSSCENNKIYYNNFINNSVNAKDEGNNTWHTGKYGNYWSDYNGTDANDDGIGNTPYNLTGGDNQDLYPLMTPYVSQTAQEFQVDEGLLYRTLVIALVAAILFVLPIGYMWYRKYYRIK